MSRTHVIMCQSRFAPIIMAGTKLSTIRGKRKRKIEIRDVLDLRQWSGLPYRSKQLKLRLVTVARVRPITVDTTGHTLEVRLDGRSIRGAALDLLVLRDGFPHFVHFAQFFTETHGEVFHGSLIEWSA
jgi:hypothetical protein